MLSDDGPGIAKHVRTRFVWQEGDNAGSFFVCNSD